MRYLFLILLLCGCAAEWDYPKVPSRNPKTGKVESKYVYYPPRHELSPLQIKTNPAPK